MRVGQLTQTTTNRARQGIRTCGNEQPPKERRHLAIEVDTRDPLARFQLAWWISRAIFSIFA